MGNMTSKHTVHADTIN